MHSKADLSIELDDSVKGNPLFTGLNDLTITKIDIFKYGALNLYVPPDKLGEYEFDYSQGKVPHLYGLYDDYITLGGKQLFNLAQEETATDVSEIIGVGVGLFYSIQLLGIEPNKIKKIKRADKQQKYLDFAFVKDQQQYEFEAKGTTYEANVKAQIEDVKLKKKDKPNTACRFGTVTLARKRGEVGSSRVIVCDAYEKVTVDDRYNIYDYLEYYLFIFSLILDNPLYNRLNKRVRTRKVYRGQINTNKIRGSYIISGVRYLGEYFDKRLLLEKIRENTYEGITLNALFKNLTDSIGNEKYFLGIDERVIAAINRTDIDYLDKGTDVGIRRALKDRAIIADKDGVIFVKSANGADKQVEENFTETNVKERLAILYNYSRNERHPCGAPCRSREKYGKPCEIMTFRDHCHFHR